MLKALLAYHYLTDCLIARRAFTDLEKVHNDLAAEKKAVEEKLHATERKFRELEHIIEEEERESSELGIHRHRLVQQLQEEREQHKKDLAERDFASDQTRKKYQGKSFLRTFLLPFTASFFSRIGSTQ